MPWTGRFELEATLVRRIDVVAVPDPEHPKQVGHLDLVLSTLHGPRRMNVGPVKQNARAHYIAALLREEMGLERVEVDDTVALEGTRIAVPATEEAAETANDRARRRR